MAARRPRGQSGVAVGVRGGRVGHGVGRDNARTTKAGARKKGARRPVKAMVSGVITPAPPRPKPEKREPVGLRNHE